MDGYTLPEPRSCSYPAPARKSVELPNGKFYTREWEPGEKKEYEESVLNR